jgi:hypothetical protein
MALESEAKKVGLKEAVLEVLLSNVDSIDFWKRMNYDPHLYENEKTTLKKTTTKHFFSEFTQHHFQIYKML